MGTPPEKELMIKNVFEDLGFSPVEAAALKLKTDLHSKVGNTDAAPLFLSNFAVVTQVLSNVIVGATFGPSAGNVQSHLRSRM